MPGGDQMGPLGRGPKTGRGLGYCAGYDQPGYATSQPAQGLGRGFRWGGRGRGWGYRFNAGFWPGRGRGVFAAPPVSQDQEIDSLKAQAQELQDALQEIRVRLDKLEA
ncbi:MAG: DUF5320 domain-containing protein [Chloroflexota bacterium]